MGNLGNFGKVWEGMSYWSDTPPPPPRPDWALGVSQGLSEDVAQLRAVTTLMGWTGRAGDQIEASWGVAWVLEGGVGAADPDTESPA